LPAMEIVDTAVIENAVRSAHKGVQTFGAPARGGDAAGEDAAVILRRARLEWRRLTSANGQARGSGAPVGRIRWITHEFAGDPNG
jgi:hypothetical protein